MKKGRKLVTIEVEGWVPRPSKRDPSVLTKKRHRTWIPICKTAVLYMDKEAILVRQLGSLSIYRREDGSMRSAGYQLKHPLAHRVPYHIGWWRINPESLKKLNSR